MPQTRPLGLGALALGLVLACAPLAALAQGQVSSPSSIVPLQAMSYGPLDAPAIPVDGSHGLPVQCLTGCASPTVPSTFTPAQVSVATTATQIVASRTGRSLLTVVNTTTTAIYLGGSGVTTSTGLLLPGTVGASLTLPYTGALYGIVASGTATVTEAETY